MMIEQNHRGEALVNLEQWLHNRLRQIRKHPAKYINGRKVADVLPFTEWWNDRIKKLSQRG